MQKQKQVNQTLVPFHLVYNQLIMVTETTCLYIISRMGSLDSLELIGKHILRLLKSIQICIPLFSFARNHEIKSLDITQQRMWTKARTRVHELLTIW